MKWEKLNNNSLEKLKNIGDKQVLVYDKTHNEFRYDIIHSIDLTDLFLSCDPEDMDNHWSSLMHGDKYEYTDSDMIDLFSYYCVLDEPGQLEDKND